MCFCALLLIPRDLRRSIKDSEEDPIVPRALVERFINFIFYSLEVEFDVDDDILKPYAHY